MQRIPVETIFARFKCNLQMPCYMWRILLGINFRTTSKRTITCAAIYFTSQLSNFVAVCRRPRRNGRFCDVKTSFPGRSCVYISAKIIPNRLFAPYFMNVKCRYYTSCLHWIYVQTYGNHCKLFKKMWKSFSLFNYLHKKLLTAVSKRDFSISLK